MSEAKDVCWTCALTMPATLRQLIGFWIRPFAGPVFCWGGHA